MPQDQEDIEHTESDGGHDKEADRSDLANQISLAVQEAPEEHKQRLQNAHSLSFLDQFGPAS